MFLTDGEEDFTILSGIPFGGIIGAGIVAGAGTLDGPGMEAGAGAIHGTLHTEDSITDLSMS